MDKLFNIDEKNEYLSDLFEGLNFSCVELDLKEFDNCIFKKCNFSEATFKRCNFIDCEFINCNLSLADMEYSKFSNVIFRESKLIGINWTKVAWPRIIFRTPIKFYKCLINDCSFYGLSLQDLVLEECKAHDVDFREGDFSNANFTHTELTGSLFANTNISGADFSEATEYDINIYQNEIKQAKFSRFEAARLLHSLDVELVD